MDRILVILKKNKCPKVFICPCTGVKYHNLNMFIGIGSRSQVSVYRTIGPLVRVCLWVGMDMKVVVKQMTLSKLCKFTQSCLCTVI